MKIRMKQTVKGSPDGINVFTYEAGKSYDIDESLAKVFIENGWAEEDKAYDQAPEIKTPKIERKIKISRKKR